MTRRRSPFFLATKNPGAHHSVGSSCRVITLSLISLSTTFSAFSLQCKGTRLAVAIRNGCFSPGVRYIFIRQPCIDSSGRSSVSTVGYLLIKVSFKLDISSKLSCDITMIGAGNVSGITFRRFRSVLPMITSFFIAGEMTAFAVVLYEPAVNVKGTTPSVGTGVSGYINVFCSWSLPRCTHTFAFRQV